MSKKPPSPPPPKMTIPPEVDMGAAREEYIRILRNLNGKIGPFDQSLLIDYANTHATILDLKKSVDIEGYTLEGPKGGQYINPTVNILISRQSHLAALRRDLFFTPRSRGEKAKPQGKALSLLERISKDDSDENQNTD